MKILVLDDQADEFIRLRRAAQEDMSITLVLTMTPATAETALKGGGFDALLLDGHLEGFYGPEINGPDVLRDWRFRGMQLPPVFMISSDKEMQNKGMLAGATGTIDKQLLNRGELQTLKKLIIAD